MELLNQRLKRAFDLTFDLVKNLSEKDLLLKLSDLPSNRLGDQLWCVVGARESYFKAIENSAWVGFDCSLNDQTSKSQVLQCLESSSENILKYLSKHQLSEAQLSLLLDLHEHEIQHHGQLIRYIYGNRLEFPTSWNERYTV